MDSEPVELMTPNPRYMRGVRDLKFKNSHVRLVKEHDLQYIQRHQLSGVLDRVWEKCLIQKPEKPLAFLANLLDPYSQREIILQLQEELSSLRAECKANPVFKGVINAIPNRDVERVRDSLTSLLIEPTVQEEFYSQVSELSPDVSERLQEFDSVRATEVTQRFLPLLRLVTDNLHDLATIEGFVRGVARLHLNNGILERDYHVMCSAVLGLVRRHLMEQASIRNDVTKRAWVRLHALITTTMCAGGQMRELHAKHQASLAPTPTDIEAIRSSLTMVNDKTSAAVAIARGAIEISPSITKLITKKGIPAAKLGGMLIDGVELVVDILETRGTRPCLDYLRVLGQRHVSHGVSQNMYPVVGQSLLAAVNHSMRRDADVVVEETVSAWRRVLDALLAMLKRPLQQGMPLPSAQTMALSELRSKQNLKPQLESDLAEIASGRATPDLTHEACDIKHATGDISNVAVSEPHLQKLFEKYDVEGSRSIAKETMVDILMSQEEFGVPVTKARATRQVEAILKKAKVEKDVVNFHLFSILMLQVAQR